MREYQPTIPPVSPKASAMKTVAAKLKASRFFAHLSEVALAGLLEEAIEAEGETGSPVHAKPADFVIVLEGGLEMRTRDGRLLASVNADQAAGEPGVLHAIPQGARLTLTRPPSSSSWTASASTTC